MEEVTITVPKALAQAFIGLAEGCSDQMGNAGCNDLLLDDTPGNRELIDLVNAENYGITLEEWRSSDHYEDEKSEPCTSSGKLFTFDHNIFNLFVAQVKKSIE